MLLFSAALLLVSTALAQVVNVQNATITGRLSADRSIVSYLSVPYAQAPVGDLRFRAPLPIFLSGDIPATNNGNRCFSGNSGAYGYMTGANASVPMSEDCLNINIFTPVNATNLPVYVSLIGGGFTLGAAQDEIYDGVKMLQRTPDVIIVVINHRLGALGFLVGNEFVEENTPMNFGLLDQQVAFEWIRDNIQAFGGDPSRVTAGGESSGAISIAYHLIANGGKQDYFQRAVIQSGGVLPRAKSINEGQKSFDSFSKHVGCGEAENKLDCLRSITNTTLINEAQNAETFGTWLPAADGNFIQRDSISPFLNEAFSKIPLLLHNVRDEGTFFSIDAGFDMFSRESTSNFTDHFNIIFQSPEKIAKLNELYPITSYPLLEPYRQFADFVGDLLFQCPVLSMATVYSAAGLPVYLDRFNHVAAKTNILGLGEIFLGVNHGTDISYLWIFSKILLFWENQLAFKYHDQIMNFVKGLPPNGDRWLEYGAERNRYDIDADKISPDTERLVKCQFIQDSALEHFASTPADQ